VLDDALSDFLCLMNIETCFLMFSNNFSPSFFTKFWGKKKENFKWC